MLYIGVDLGTSAVKLLLMDGSGRIHKVVSREYPLYFPPSRMVGTEPGGLVYGLHGRHEGADLGV